VATPSEARRALVLVTAAAVAEAVRLAPLGAEAVTAGVPEVIAYYSLGSAALAADHYDETRLVAGARGRFTAEPVIPDRAEKIRRASLWAVKPLFDATIAQTTESRIAEVVQLEVARAHRETTIQNAQVDPESLGWSRVTRGDGCKFCLMLAAKGARYKEGTARFAAHANCNCAAQAWFKGQKVGEEADALQHIASGRKRTAAEKARLRDYLNGTFPDAPG